ncbi:protein A30 [Aotine betaherpesvirus 1]|uniref:Protein A30 n=1 Tax=Aotine betaherpesvirus 1 TaxID=50290 RepID=G8XUK4_9BETA|nr:protein A30 [Aotine betaherpesvirus 1]AEV80846.1 protein A30 [Aotine betaherpesvirus 1]
MSSLQRLTKAYRENFAPSCPSALNLICSFAWLMPGDSDSNSPDCIVTLESMPPPQREPEDMAHYQHRTATLPRRTRFHLSFGVILTFFIVLAWTLIVAGLFWFLLSP